MPIFEIVSATRLDSSQFWTESALGQSLTRLKNDKRITNNICFCNQNPLPLVYNKAIQVGEDDSILIFVHDDVWIDDYNLCDSLQAGLLRFDVIGLAGNKRRVPGQPSWCFLDSSFSQDLASNLSGAVAHGPTPFGEVSYFGETFSECELLDGVFLASKRGRLRINNILFDPLFKFHFYDMDFCRQSRAAGLRLGTWPIAITHQSTGAYGSTEWSQAYKDYLNKYEEDGSRVHNLLSQPSADDLQEQIVNSLLELINKISGFRRIIEVGCGKESLCQARLASSPEIEYVYFNTDQFTSRDTNLVVGKALVVDIEILSDDQWNLLFPCDVWIFSNSLESLRSPWHLLKRIRESCNPGQRIIASIYNAQNWGLQLRLLAGALSYENGGAFDSRRLRWFSKNTIYQSFLEMGFMIEEFREVLDESQPGEACLTTLAELAEITGAQRSDALDCFLPLYYVVSAFAY